MCGELFMLCDVEIPNWGMSAETDIAGDEMGLVMQQVTHWKTTRSQSLNLIASDAAQPDTAAPVHAGLADVVLAPCHTH